MAPFQQQKPVLNLFHYSLGWSSLPSVVTLITLESFHYRGTTVCLYWTRQVVREWIWFSSSKYCWQHHHMQTYGIPYSLFSCLMQNCFWKRNAFHMEINPALDSYLQIQLSWKHNAMAYKDVVVVYRQNRSIKVISYRS